MSEYKAQFSQSETTCFFQAKPFQVNLYISEMSLTLFRNSKTHDFNLFEVIMTFYIDIF